MGVDMPVGAICKPKSGMLVPALNGFQQKGVSQSLCHHFEYWVNNMDQRHYWLHIEGRG